MPTSAALVQPIDLETSLVDAKLAAPSYAKALREGLGLATVGDILRHFPRRYEDRVRFKPITQLRAGEAVTVAGRIVGVSNVKTRSRMVITKVVLRDCSEAVTLIFFNQWFLKKQFEQKMGQTAVAYGRVSPVASSRGIELTEVEWEVLEPGADGGEFEPIHTNRIVPIYPLADGVRQERLRKLIWDALALAVDQVTDPLPASVSERNSLLSSVQALRQIHFPDSFQLLDEAKRRLAFDEFLILQLALIFRRREAKRERGIAFAGGDAAVGELTAALPFALTPAQRRVIGEIGRDMESPEPMNRLLQGDVGSGKTMVAVAAMLTAVRSGYQAALMVPTEILAEQHYSVVQGLLKSLDISVVLLMGSLTAKEKADRARCVADGHYPIVIGTHALIQEAVEFNNLGLAIIDEQHRFGVMQRAALRSKRSDGITPDVLVMTATPIPRTLTMTVYGDLDVSVIDALPPGRKAIRTHWKRGEDRASVYETLRGLMAEGRQAYVICPLVAESEKLQAKAATELAQHLASDVFLEFKVGLLHGQLKPAQKDEAMEDFRERRTDLLVSTNVIEVGVDVPNASIVVIEDADRFGLAQLHQLRGRVGRGETQSYCLLVADPRNADAVVRMEAMTRTCDGFEIAEQDLKLRGPGDFHGTRQSGLEMLPFIDVVRDLPILLNARDEASRILDDDPELRKPDNAGLKRIAVSKFRLISQFSGSN